MQPRRNSLLIYGLLLGVWLLVVAWQVEEHVRVREAAKSDLRNRSNEIANTLSAVIRALRFRSTVLQNRLEPVLNLLVNGHTNELVKSSVTFVNPVEGASVSEGVTNNATVVLPSSFRGLTNGMHGGERDFPRPEPPPGAPPLTNGLANTFTNGGTNGLPDKAGARPRDGSRRPPWMRWMSDADFKALAATHELHGLVLAMSTENYRAICVRDWWLRFVIIFFAGMAAAGAGL